MWEVTRKGLVAHKFRLLLTSISIVLGVAFVAGTFVFTDTIGSVFDHLFTQTTSGTDAVVRASLPFKVNTQGNAPQDRAPVPDSLVPLVRSTSGAAEAQGSVGGYALVIGKDGKAVQGQAPTIGVSWGPIPRFAKSFNVKRGSRPTLPTQVGLDETTAKKAKVDVGDTVRVVFLTVPPEEFKVSAVFKFGDAGNLAGATLAAFEPGTAQRVLNKIGVWDEIDAAAKSGVSQEQLRDAISTKLRQAGLGVQFRLLHHVQRLRPAPHVGGVSAARRESGRHARRHQHRRGRPVADGDRGRITRLLSPRFHRRRARRRAVDGKGRASARRHQDAGLPSLRPA